MIIKILYCLITSLLLSVILGAIFIKIFRKKRFGQPVYKYVESHKEKNGTPTMGGLFFLLTAVICYLIFSNKSRLSVVALVIGLAFMVVGFLDDFIKIKSRENQGLKAYQKIIFQLSIAISSGVFCYLNGLTIFYLPFSKTSINLGVFTIFFVAFIFVAITNSVNLTDGLDGLSGGVSVVYLIFIVILMILQSNLSTMAKEETDGLIILSISLVGALMGFLIYNTNKASVFMGDTGSLSLGGFIGAISIFSGNSFFIPLFGIMFMTSSISVIMQVIYYKRTKKRIFLMAPYHHHLQMKGYSESKISYLYAVVTGVVSCVSIIGYL